MSEPVLNAVGGKLLHTVDFTPEVPAGATVSNIAFQVPSPLSSWVITPDLTNGKSTIGLQGATHGGQWRIRALATLSNGEDVPKYFDVRGFNG